jgi:hypothetical protein
MAGLFGLKTAGEKCMKRSGHQRKEGYAQLEGPEEYVEILPTQDVLLARSLLHFLGIISTKLSR